MARTAAPKSSGLVAVGRVTKPHGIRGEFCVESHADSPLLFAPGKTVFLALPAPAGKGGAPQRPKPYEVATLREHTGRLLLTLKGLADRTFAETLRGAEVLVAEADLPEPDEGEVYLHRLLGSRVLLADDTLVGEFESILDTPGNDTWVIRAPSGREVLLPAVPEFVLSLDADAGEIRIDPPEGLLELYLSEPTPSGPKEASQKKAGPKKHGPKPPESN